MRAAFAVGHARDIDGALCIGGLAHERGLLVGFVLGDIKLARHRDLHRIEGQGRALALGFVDADALGDLLRAGILIEDQIEAARGGAADRIRAAGGHPERRMRLLRRRRLDDDILEMPEAAAMGKALARGKGALHHLDGLVEARLGFLRRDLKALELAVPVALADAEIEAAAGNQIERRRLFGEQHRIVPGQHHHRRAEPQRLGAHGERHQQHQRRGHLVPAGEMMLDQKARRKAERFGLDVEVEPVAKALAGFRAEIAAVGLRGMNRPNFMATLLSERCTCRIVSEPRNVGKRHAAGMHVHAAELGAAVQRRKHLAGIEQALVVEGAFEPLLLIEIGLRKTSPASGRAFPRRRRARR